MLEHACSRELLTMPATRCAHRNPAVTKPKEHAYSQAHNKIHLHGKPTAAELSRLIFRRLFLTVIPMKMR